MIGHLRSQFRRIFGDRPDLSTGGHPITFGRPPAPLPSELPLSGPDWVQAEPAWIRGALERALRKPTGGWAVVGASRELGHDPKRVELLGEIWALFRSAGGDLAVAPDACPHMGASLSEGRVDARGRLLCPWHGMPASPCRERSGVAAHDDGVLLWIRHPLLLAPGEEPSARPSLPERPGSFLDAVMSVEARCEPRDVLANRLDPWHGNHFHPHSFSGLRVIAISEEEVTVRVIYRVLPRLGVEVDARFHCPDARTIVMTILDGEGRGSVVETHATPLSGPAAEGRCLITEATLATSERPEFAGAVALAGLLRPLVVARAERLWVEDAAYAERLYELRERARRPEQRRP